MQCSKSRRKALSAPISLCGASASMLLSTVSSRRCPSSGTQSVCQHAGHIVACQHHRPAVPLWRVSSSFNGIRQPLQQRQTCSRPARSCTVRTNAMFGNWFKSDEAGKTRKKYQERVDKINALEARYQAISDEELKSQTQALRERVQGGEALESVLPEAFAVRLSVASSALEHVHASCREWRPPCELGQMPACRLVICTRCTMHKVAARHRVSYKFRNGNAVRTPLV